MAIEGYNVITCLTCYHEQKINAEAADPVCAICGTILRAGTAMDTLELAREEARQMHVGMAYGIAFKADDDDQAAAAEIDQHLKQARLL